MYPQWMLAFYQVAHGFSGGIPALARTLGKNPKVLQNKVDPGCDTHGIYVEEFMAVQEACGDFSPFILLGREHGITCVPSAPDTASDNLLHTLARLQAEHGDVAREALAALHDGNISINDRKRLIKEFRDLLRVVHEGMASLDAGAES